MTLEVIKTWVVAQFKAYTAKVKEYVTKVKTEIEAKIPSQEEIAKYFNAAPVYNSESKKIEFYHDSTKVAELDATAFIKDGMVNTVSITDGKTDGANNGKKVLLITFNTDAGKEDIEIPLENIFKASDYYTKNEADSTFVKNADWESKTGDFLTEDDLEPYAKSAEVYSKTEADGKFVQQAELTDIDASVWNEMWQDAQ